MFKSSSSPFCLHLACPSGYGRKNKAAVRWYTTAAFSGMGGVPVTLTASPNCSKPSCPLHFSRVRGICQGKSFLELVHVILTAIIMQQKFHILLILKNKFSLLFAPNQWGGQRSGSGAGQSPWSWLALGVLLKDTSAGLMLSVRWAWTLVRQLNISVLSYFGDINDCLVT